MKSPLTLAIALLSVLLFSCSKSHDIQSPTFKQLIESRWSIQMKESGQDISSSFAPYTLLFAENGSVALKSSQEVNIGKWTISSDGNAHTALKLSFNAAMPCLEKLSSAWILETNAAHQLAFRKTGGDDQMTLSTR